MVFAKPTLRLLFAYYSIALVRTSFKTRAAHHTTKGAANNLIYFTGFKLSLLHTSLATTFAAPIDVYNKMPSTNPT